jgi:hypothetical protein
MRASDPDSRWSRVSEPPIDAVKRSFASLGACARDLGFGFISTSERSGQQKVLATVGHRQRALLEKVTSSKAVSADSLNNWLAYDCWASPGAPRGDPDDPVVCSSSSDKKLEAVADCADRPRYALPRVEYFQPQTQRREGTSSQATARSCSCPLGASVRFRCIPVKGATAWIA